MKDAYSYNREEAFSEEIVQFINDMDVFFVPKISSQSDISELVNKVLKHGFILSCRNQDNNIVGLSMFYANNLETKTTYLSYIAVSERRGGIGQELLEMMESISRKEGMEKITLKTHSSNERAIGFYKKNQYEVLETTEDKGRIAIIFEKNIA